MRARQVAGCILAVVALAGCVAPQQYTTVTVAKWTPTNTPWNSTLWGIASHYKLAGGYQTLMQFNGLTSTVIYPNQQIRVPM